MRSILWSSHPFLFALWPILFLFANNISEIAWKELVAPVSIALVGTTLLFGFLLLFFQHLQKAALLTSLFAFLFFSYGHFRVLFESIFPVRLGLLGAEIYFTLLWGLILGALLYKPIQFAEKDLSAVTRVVCVVGIFLMVMPLVAFGSSLTLNTSELGVSHTTVSLLQASARPPVLGRGSMQKEIAQPDIYYIILDGYGRTDVFQEIYGYDNSDFLKQLEERGFFVAHKSTANYSQTLLSLTSSMNLAYLPNILGRDDYEDASRMGLRKHIRESALLQFMRDQGYTVISFVPDYFGFKSNKKPGDVYISIPRSDSEFHETLLNTTPAFVFADIFTRMSVYDAKRYKIQFLFEKLAGIPDVGTPRFVFGHITSPHPLFVFDADGNPINIKGYVTGRDGSHFLKDGGTVEDYQRYYPQQVAFLNAKIIEMVDRILARAEAPPVIILQGDHGPGSLMDYENAATTNMRERLSILNAYYFPDGDYRQLYESITPVNTFRVLLNKYFDENYELLEDKSYYAFWSRPYDFIDVTEEVR